MISKISIHVKVKNIVKGEFLTPEMFKVKQTSAREGEDYRSWEVTRVEGLLLQRCWRKSVSPFDRKQACFLPVLCQWTEGNRARYKGTSKECHGATRQDEWGTVSPFFPLV